jgi:hypothetical protein
MIVYTEVSFTSFTGAMCQILEPPRLLQARLLWLACRAALPFEARVQNPFPHMVEVQKPKPCI